MEYASVSFVITDVDVAIPRVSEEGPDTGLAQNGLSQTRVRITQVQPNPI